jgi:polyisoprenoid-binding protein YceI
MKKLFAATLLLASSILISAQATDYVIDTQGAHASINFKVSHLGFSWVTGRFNKFDGKFTIDDANFANSTVEVNIDPSSVDTNHAERNKHLRSGKFLDTKHFATAKFVSTSVQQGSNDTFKLMGNLTLHGVTKAITIDAVKIGEGSDPWGGYRAGFSGTTTIAMKDFGLKTDFGNVILELVVEGVRQ